MTRAAGSIASLSLLAAGVLTASQPATVRSGVARALAFSDAQANAISGSAPESIPATLAPSAMMERIAAYVERYGREASVIVSTEHYTQRVLSAAPVATLDIARRRAVQTTRVRVESQRRLVSELALVRNDAAIGGWLGYRDVVEVDGGPVGDRRDRLQALFSHDTPNLEEAKRITADSARFNMGPVIRTFNVPTATLFFFHPGNLARFVFRRKGAERIDGAETWKIDFQETRSPSLIMNGAGKDVMSSGTLWLNPADCSVLRTRLVVSHYRGPASRAEVEVTYHRDPGVGILVPVKMTEAYHLPGFEVTGEATYSDYKRFQTGVRLK